MTEPKEGTLEAFVRSVENEDFWTSEETILRFAQTVAQFVYEQIRQKPRSDEETTLFHHSAGFNLAIKFADQDAERLGLEVKK